MHVMNAVQGSDARVDPPPDEQVDAVLRASRALVGIAASSLAEVDAVVTVPQLRVLMMVHTRGPLNVAAVAAGMAVSPSNASRVCDRLIKAGLLNRRESTSDRRHVSLTLTDAGCALVEKVTGHRRAAVERALRNMSAPQRQPLVEALNGFAVAAGEPADPAVALWPSTR
jgi:DNA-binding MarR family transcriptional regulator